MTVYCYLCQQPFRDGSEVAFTGLAYWHELKSKVAYSITQPHEVYADTMHHTDCPNAS